MAPPPRNEVRLAIGDGRGEQWSSVGRFDERGFFRFPKDGGRPAAAGSLDFESQVVGLEGDWSMSGADPSAASSRSSLTPDSKLRFVFNVEVPLGADVSRCLQLQTRHAGKEKVEWAVPSGTGRIRDRGSPGESGGPSVSSDPAAAPTSRRRSRAPSSRGVKAAGRQKDIRVLREAIRQHKRSESRQEKDLAVAEELTSRMSELTIRNDGFDRDEDYDMLSPLLGRVRVLDRMEMD